MLAADCAVRQKLSVSFLKHGYIVQAWAASLADGDSEWSMERNRCEHTE